MVIGAKAMTDLLKNPIFKDETAAREWLEARVWARGRVCPHCGQYKGREVIEVAEA